MSTGKVENFWVEEAIIYLKQYYFDVGLKLFFLREDIFCVRHVNYFWERKTFSVCAKRNKHTNVVAN